MEEITIQDLINNMPWLSPEQKELLNQYKLVLGDESFTDVDNKIMYYTAPEFAYHEAYHAIGDNQDFENKYSEFFHNLDDEKIKGLGANWDFVKKDPSYFYHPSEVLARVMASNYMLQQHGITPDINFFKELRNTPDKYGNNLRDLLNMYNNANLEKLFNWEDYQAFKNSLPDNLRLTPDSEYDTYTYWKSWGKPKDFNYTLTHPNEDGDYMYNWDDSDKSFHGSSIGYIDGIGHFIKPKDHDTVKYELDYYNDGTITEEGGIQREPTEEERKEWEEFRSQYELHDDGSNFYKYVPKKFKSGGKMEMKETIIKISDKTYLVQIAETEEERATGLSKTESLDKESGMLFVIPDDLSEVVFTTADMSYDLDIIFIDEDDEVIDVQLGKAGSEEPIISYGNIKYVLEVNADSGIKEGEELEFTDCPDCEEVDDEEVAKMYVIGPDGQPQMELLGGERIFSRENTKTLIRLAKRANKSKSDSDYKKLGRKIFKYLEIQDNREPEYV